MSQCFCNFHFNLSSREYCENKYEEECSNIVYCKKGTISLRICPQLRFSISKSPNSRKESVLPLNLNKTEFNLNFALKSCVASGMLLISSSPVNVNES